MNSSNVGFGVMGWAFAQIFCLWKGIYNTGGAIVGLALTVGLILGIEWLVNKVMENDGK